jgi:hypothetical protein
MSGPAWLAQSNVPPPRTEDKLLAFFGIPPDGLDKLDDNIARKRRDWYAKYNGVSAKGRDRAKAVLELIHSGSAALKRGEAVDEVTGGAEQSQAADDLLVTLDDLWGTIDDLLSRDEFEHALRVAAEARNRWPDSSRPVAAYAWVVYVGWQAEFFIRQSMLENGVQLAEQALRAGGQDRPEQVVTWDCRAGLQLALDRPGQALATLGEAERELGVLPPVLRIHRAQGLLVTDQTDEGMIEAIRAVLGARHDRALLHAVRARCATMLVHRLVERLLPIADHQRLQRYVEAVDVAAWCARGVPEAEDLVRSHRLWAAQAGQLVFAGSWEWRSFLAVCTAFASLFVHNRVNARAAWQVYMDGPTAGETWRLIANTGFVRSAHRPVDGKLPWRAAERTAQ